ncbi:MAG TPA: hypothetical protein H9912_02410, partial [Candidatus Eisenbergiella stercorigallinarum]|nr:hypothetical protein [Candidatus Eisenbergiella stercorigallinarum]
MIEIIRAACYNDYASRHASTECEKSKFFFRIRITMYERILTDFDIRTIMDSGQVFRIRPLLRDGAPASGAETGSSP